MSDEKKNLMETLVDEIPPADERFFDKCSDVTDQIAALLEETGMTQRDLARKMGKRESYISRVLSGGVNLTLRTIAELEAALEADLLVAPMYAGRDEGEASSPPAFRKSTETQRFVPRAAESRKEATQGFRATKRSARRKHSTTGTSNS